MFILPNKELKYDTIESTLENYLLNKFENIFQTCVFNRKFEEKKHITILDFLKRWYNKESKKIKCFDIIKVSISIQVDQCIHQ
jgi:hypothetical protein